MADVARIITEADKEILLAFGVNPGLLGMDAKAEAFGALDNGRTA
jgi:hypothetical protein